MTYTVPHYIIIDQSQREILVRGPKSRVAIDKTREVYRYSYAIAYRIYLKSIYII